MSDGGTGEELLTSVGAAPSIRMDVLEARAALLADVREFFRERGFLEVDTPILCSEVIVDRYIEPYVVPMESRSAHMPRTYWLQTSPEYCMKRLLVVCRRSIFQICHAFRRGERGRLHNPEFTMLEWYEVGADYQAGMETTSQLAERVLGRGAAQRLSYREAFRQLLNVDPFTASVTQLEEVGKSWDHAVPGGLDDRDSWLEYLMVTRVEPHLGRQVPVIVYDYPASQAALAQLRTDDVCVAERFELYVDGIEVANGYHELRDAEELAARMRENNRVRVRRGAAALPEPHRFIAAMKQGLPPCTGVALGLDRLLMLRLGLECMDQVCPFPLETA